MLRAWIALAEGLPEAEFMARLPDRIERRARHKLPRRYQETAGSAAVLQEQRVIVEQVSGWCVGNDASTTHHNAA